MLFEKRRAVAIEISNGIETKTIHVKREIVLSLGAINTPRLLMLSGIGDSPELSRIGIPVLQHLPGVGKNLQDQLRIPGFVWERADTQAEVAIAPRMDVHAKSRPHLKSPDINCLQIDGSLMPLGLDQEDCPKNTFSLVPGLKRPSSRGRVLLASPEPDAAPVVHSNHLETPGDMQALLAAVQLARDLADSEALRPLLKRETITADLRGKELEDFVRQNVAIYWHESCTAKMGKDEMSVVDGQLKVYGIEGLRIADASVFPFVPTGLTMAPSVIVGERAAQLLKEL